MNGVLIFWIKISSKPQYNNIVYTVRPSSANGIRGLLGNYYYNIITKLIQLKIGHNNYNGLNSKLIL